MLRIGLDIDEVLADFFNPYVKRFGVPKKDYEITKNCVKLQKDRDFWINLPVINKPEGFIPTLYCTKRSCLKSYTKTWLRENEFSDKPVYQVICQCSNKANYIKGRVDVFIDDNITNFTQMNKSGVPCLLFHSKYNEHWGPIGRIYSLDISEIEDAYWLLMNTVFNDFEKLL